MQYYRRRIAKSEMSYESLVRIQRVTEHLKTFRCARNSIMFMCGKVGV